MSLDRAALAALAFLAAVTYLPNVIDPAATGRWAVLAAGIPLALMLYGARIPAPLNGWGLACMALLGLSAFAAYFGPDEAALNATYEYIHLIILAGAFCLGAAAEDLRPAWWGLGAGVLVSALIGIAQVAGGTPALEAHGIIVSTPPYAGGLFMNKNMLAEAGMVALIPALFHGWWIFAACALTAVLLGGSKAVCVALAVVLIIWAWEKYRTLAMVSGMIFGAAALTWLLVGDHSTLGYRVTFWQRALEDPALFGHGLAAYSTKHPDLMYAHSEYLQAFYELGVLAMVPAAILLRCLERVRRAVYVHGRIIFTEVAHDHEAERLILIALLVVAAAAFPLHLPLTAFAAALAAGRLAGFRTAERGLEHLRAAAFEAASRARTVDADPRARA